MRSDITPGSRPPDVELPDHENLPRLREAWDAGDLPPFHGWNRRISSRGSADGAVR
jgi:hypothetical protein